MPDRILIAEDERELRALLEDVLRDAGYDVVAFGSADAALRFLDRRLCLGKIAHNNFATLSNLLLLLLKSDLDLKRGGTALLGLLLISQHAVQLLASFGILSLELRFLLGETLLQV